MKKPKKVSSVRKLSTEKLKKKFSNKFSQIPVNWSGFEVLLKAADTVSIENTVILLDEPTEVGVGVAAVYLFLRNYEIMHATFLSETEVLSFISSELETLPLINDFTDQFSSFIIKTLKAFEQSVIDKNE